MKSVLPCLVVISSCAAMSCAPGDSAPSVVVDVASPPGQVVEKVDARIWCMLQDRSGAFWFGSNGSGVYRFDGERITQFTSAHGLNGEQIRGIYQDVRGDILVTTSVGASRFDGTTFTTLEIVEASSEEEGWELNADDLWLVVRPGEHGPCRYDGERIYQLKLSKSPAEDAHRARYPESLFEIAGVYSVFKDRRGHIWIGTAAAGLCRFDGEQLSWMYEERLTTTPEGGAFGIRSIFEDRDGAFWICNTRQRFDIARASTVKDGFNVLSYEKRPGLPHAQTDAAENFSYVPSMIEDDTGALWMAHGSDGIWKFDGTDVTKYAPNGAGYVIGVLCDRDGRIWANTLERGVFTLEGDRFEPFTFGVDVAQ